MPNRFTEKLDALVPGTLVPGSSSLNYIYWGHLWEILPRKLVEELVVELTHFRLDFSSIEHFEPIKALALCFIAEMSDEDLMEVFGI